MAHESALGSVVRLSQSSSGVFRGRDAVSHGLSRNQITRLVVTGAIERLLPDTYRIAGPPPTHEQMLRAALSWAGPGAVAAGRSAGELYNLEGVRAPVPEIVVPRTSRKRRAGGVVTHASDDRLALMVRRHRGFAVTGVETTLVTLAAQLDDEAFEIACEDARRRRLTSIPALRAYLDRYGRAGRPGVGRIRRSLRDLDPVTPSRSTLEVKARRMLLAHGLSGFVREFPLETDGRVHRFDFAFVDQRTILETNGRRWHDDASDYEHDNEKWSVPARHGFRLVLATWKKVTREPGRLVNELTEAMNG